MPNAVIRHIDEAEEYFFAEGCHIVELSNAPHDPEVSIARARVEPGITTRWHSLTDITERYVILAGRGRVEVGNLPAAMVGPGDTVVIPPDTPQRIANGGHHDLVFLAICSPRFVESAYRDLEAD